MQQSDWSECYNHGTSMYISGLLAIRMVNLPLCMWEGQIWCKIEIHIALTLTVGVVSILLSAGPSSSLQ